MSRPDLSLKRPATEPVAEPVAEPEADQYDDSEAPQLMNIGEHGNISYADIYSLEQYLDAAPDKAEALEIIIADISDIIENEESFKGWTSEVYDLIARKQYWYQFIFNTQRKGVRHLHSLALFS
ncbi:hypothetical protein E0Z10_g7933 [Xylaria hypoxylon]|uniref:Uncharacterized protein n=1 Tax=Xylaria hypoxylon TaxID=37992 RepID=A0A4Z0YL11_9PEZI|nr:hypothetical protein E0Z10_g7933 [Xylaria hypoxylon]